MTTDNSGTGEKRPFQGQQKVGISQYLSTDNQNCNFALLDRPICPNDSSMSSHEIGAEHF